MRFPSVEIEEEVNSTFHRDPSSNIRSVMRDIT